MPRKKDGTHYLHTFNHNLKGNYTEDHKPVKVDPEHSEEAKKTEEERVKTERERLQKEHKENLTYNERLLKEGWSNADKVEITGDKFGISLFKRGKVTDSGLTIIETEIIDTPGGRTKHVPKSGDFNPFLGVISVVSRDYTGHYGVGTVVALNVAYPIYNFQTLYDRKSWPIKVDNIFIFPTENFDRVIDFVYLDENYVL